MIASAISLNTGTVDGDWYESMLAVADQVGGNILHYLSYIGLPRAL